METKKKVSLFSKRILCLILSLTMTFSVFAGLNIKVFAYETENGIVYEIWDDYDSDTDEWIFYVEVTGYNGTETEVDIPSHIDGNEVRDIGYGVFLDNETVTKVNLPYTIQWISSNAFLGSAVTDVYFDIEEYEWYDVKKTSGLHDVKTTLADGTVIEPAQYFEDDEYSYHLYFGEVSITEYFGSDANVVVPTEIDGYTVVGVISAFKYNETLETLTIPGSVSEVKSSAVYECPNLTEVYFSEGTTVISSDAIMGGCPNLTTVHLPYTLGDFYGFDYVDSLKNIYYPGTYDEFRSIAQVDLSEYNLYLGDGFYPAAELVTAADGVIYKIFGGEAKVVGFEGTGETATIGTYFNDYPVVDVELHTFENTTVKTIYFDGDLETWYCFSNVYSIENIKIVASDGMQYRYEYDNFKILEREESVEIYYYTGTAVDVEIPETINGKPVTVLEDYLFEDIYGYDYENDCELTREIKVVRIPATVGYIGYGAFYNSSITDIFFDGTKEEFENIYSGETRSYNLHFTDGDLEAAKTVTLDNGVVCQIYDGIAEITGYIGTETVVEIPAEIDGKFITHINLCEFHDAGVTEIHYAGSSNDWDNLAKTYYTDELLKSLTIVCSDSTIEPPVEYKDSQGIVYEIYCGEATIIDYIGSATKITIPTEVKGVEVTGIELVYEETEWDYYPIGTVLSDKGIKEINCDISYEEWRNLNGNWSYEDSYYSGITLRLANDYVISSGVTSDGFVYTRKDRYVTINGYTGNKSTVTVPKKIAGGFVNTIGTYAFASSYDSDSEYTGVKVVKLPRTITSIEWDAFSPAVTDVYFDMSYNLWKSRYISVSSLENATLHFTSGGPVEPAKYGATEDIEYKVHDGVAVITNIDSSATVVNIPYVIEGVNLTSIDVYLYEDDCSIETIKFDGTMEQWENVYYPELPSSIVIECTDGTIKNTYTEEGTVTAENGIVYEFHWGDAYIIDYVGPAGKLDIPRFYSDCLVYFKANNESLFVDKGITEINYDGDMWDFDYFLQDATIGNVLKGITLTTTDDTVKFIADGDYEYAEFNNYVGIAGYTGSEEVINVPDKYNGKPVTEIMSGAFKYAEATTINYPASLNVISHEGYNLSTLTDIYFDGTYADWNSIPQTSYYYINLINLHFEDREIERAHSITVDDISYEVYAGEAYAFDYLGSESSVTVPLFVQDNVVVGVSSSFFADSLKEIYFEGTEATFDLSSYDTSENLVGKKLYFTDETVEIVVTDKGEKFIVYSDCAELVDCYTDATEYEIPATVNGKPVTNANFYWLSSGDVKKLTIPASIESIEYFYINSLEEIYYTGTRKQFEEAIGGALATRFASCTIHFGDGTKLEQAKYGFLEGCGDYYIYENEVYITEYDYSTSTPSVPREINGSKVVYLTTYVDKYEFEQIKFDFTFAEFSKIIDNIGFGGYSIFANTTIVLKDETIVGTKEVTVNNVVYEVYNGKAIPISLVKPATSITIPVSVDGATVVFDDTYLFNGVENVKYLGTKQQWIDNCLKYIYIDDVTVTFKDGSKLLPAEYYTATDGVEYYIFNDTARVVDYTGTSDTATIKAEIKGAKVDYVDIEAFAYTNNKNLTTIVSEIPKDLLCKNGIPAEMCRFTLKFPDGTVIEPTKEVKDGNGIVYEVYDGEATVIGYEGTATEVSIPETINLSSVTERTASNSSKSANVAKVTRIAGYAFKNSKATVVKLTQELNIYESAFVGSDVTDFYVNQKWSEANTLYHLCQYVNVHYTDKVDKLLTDEGITADGIIYCVHGDYVSISCNSKKKTIVVPETIDGYPVKEIDPFGFQDCRVETIKLPDTIEVIREGAFYNTNISEINLPDSLRFIGGVAFANTDELTNIDIPASVEAIQLNVFMGSAVTDINVDSRNKYYTDVDGVLFNKDKTTLITYPCAKKDSSYTVPSSVKEIAESAFSYSLLKTLNVLGTVEKIGSGAFEGSGNLETLNLGKGIKEIGNGVFVYCNSLKTLTIPDGIKTIGDEQSGEPYYGIAACRKLETLVLPASIEYVSIVDCPALKTIVYKGSPEQWKKVVVSAFGELDNVQIVYGGESCDKVGHSYEDGVCLVCGNWQNKGKAVTLKSAQNAEKGVLVKWNELAGSEQYLVYRRTAKSGWKLVGTTEGTSFVDGSAKSNTKYWYTVKAQNGKTYSKYHKTGLAVNYLATPKISVSNATSGIKVAWGKITGATTYTVYRLSGSSWKKLGSTSGTSYTDKTAKSGTIYTYTVRAGNKTTKSYYDEDGKSLLRLSDPKLSASNDTNGVKVKWGAVAGATSYTVYRKGSKGWEIIGTTEGTSFTDTNVKSGKKYTYTVRATADKVQSYYNKSGVTLLRLDNPELKIGNATSGLKVSWGKVAGANSYIVYRLSGSKWKKLGTTGGTSYTDKTANSGSTYTYTVRAAYKSVLSYYDTDGVSLLRLDTPKVEVTNTATDVKISWGNVKGATLYTVYRKEGNAWVVIGTTEGTSFIDEKAVAGKSYTYTVRASADDIWSYYIKDGVKTTKLSVPTLSKVTVSKGRNVVYYGKVTGADKYDIYRKTGNGGWKKIATTTSTQYTDKSVKKGTTYTYTVRAVKGSAMSYYNTTGLKVKAK